eukprot:966984-Amphidinium_carterae.2
MVFLPKHAGAILEPSAMRPISLLNTLYKLPCAVIARAFLAASATWVSVSQHGFTCNPDCASALEALETGVLDFAAASPSSCVLLADICQAFPATRRDWVRL